MRSKHLAFPFCRRRSARSAGLLFGAAMAATAAAADGGAFTDMSLEQLGEVVVTSLSRQDERLSDAAAALFVIGADDIRRSGARSIPEALRLAPNLQVARVDARNYAITARGFNSPFENKLLVLIDGRSVYSPLFSGVFWDVQEVVMEDIARIEVISGPGATIWGANAVNGVINVITRPAADSRGGLFAASAGAREQDGTLRYGGALPAAGHYRLYAKYVRADATETAAGLDTVTGWRRAQAGLRADWALARGALSLSGDAYDGALGQRGTADILVSGANLRASLTRQLDGGAELRLEATLDHTERNQPNAFVERLDTLTLEAQHSLRLAERHNVSWGGGYRQARDKVANGAQFAFLPGDTTLRWANLFAQDEVALRPELRLTAGLKVEHNNYTGAELLPSLRLAWSPDTSQLWWTSLSRSVRAPSRIDRDLFAPGKPIIIAGKPFYPLAGGPRFESEVAKVLELGYRAQPRPQWSYTVAVYVADYDKLRTLEPHAGASSLFSNMGEGRSHGLEAWGRWQAAPDWRLSGGLVLQHVETRLKAGSHDASGATGLATNDPNLHWSLRSSHDLAEHWQLDLSLRHTGKLPRPVVAAYHELDLQLLWQPRPDLDVALLGQNLLHAHHDEFGPVVGRSVIERSLLLKLTKRF
ncbi:TonB-dependent receptor plug domain-containing protein [Rugamonas sp. CCM 8940]|uniref:TonB-dependent receptor plug domain-containing protein n=1 Tax=Rugamonas sp. CCM 8940 TaxID=2765359 RepID=UPI0018F575D2|nr:TonB-dependent receptor [Rugamonas sp. CCM 8940]MBJ7313104.1 TonB-dependent receptor [Rugamonas sp. CCM 8940]